MKYLKYFESNNEDDENLKDLIVKLQQLNRTFSHVLKANMPYELIEDYFLIYLDNDWKLVDKTVGKFYKKVSFQKIYDRDKAENTFYDLLKELDKTIYHLQHKWNFHSYYQIYCNGVSQQEHNPKTIRNDKYVWNEPPKEEYSYRTGSNTELLPDDKILFRIDFWMT